MKPILAAVVLLLPSLSRASSVEAFKAAPFEAATAQVRFARRPRVGTMTGGLGGAPVDLKLDRNAWTITGGANGAPLDLSIDHDNARVSGGAGGVPVDLSFAWSAQRIVYRGAGGFTLDWNAKTLKGEGLDLKFDLQAGTVAGGAWGYQVDLRYDAVSGKLTGGMNGAPVDATLVNMDLSDLLTYFFALRKPVVAQQ